MIEFSLLKPLGQSLGWGSTAGVHSVGYRIPSDPRPLVFKELKPETELKAGGFNRDALVKDMANCVQARMALSPQDRQDLDETSAWPLDLVQDRGRVVGVVMPLIPADYFIATHQQGQPPGETQRDLAQMIAANEWATKMGVDRSAFTDPFDRALILINLVYAVARLHKHRIVYGDLSLKNAVFSSSSHNVLLLDCDGTASLNDPHRVQPHSPFFTPPEIANKSTRLQDTRTDVYKLALCIIRGLQPPSRTAGQAANPEPLKPILGAGGVAELRRALDPDPNKRPTAKDLFIVLKAYHDAQVQPPVIHAFHPLRASVPSGGDVVLLWDVQKHGRHEGMLHSPDGARQRVGLADGRAKITVGCSGTVRLDVVGMHGVAASQSRHVQVLDEPRPADVQEADLF